MKIRKDKYGLHIRSRWGKSSENPAYRPGTFPGHSHAWDTSSGELKENDNPKTNHVRGEPFIRITLDNGHELHWGSYDRKEGDFPENSK